ncbi:sigma-70 family RNA polymerase sigma factor [Catenovulum sp. 2E275]|uniref:sigma-70 family RNA polymerase sigma factor n=1 Tax=Catenovulum sp. 2E275 TaxID=2980497 RepID=UPI0021D0529F|nr:sigma-70 family RNA polymerase sigma factor [Catenovulum sp. 2E275]MCU4675296.1 sigma-70 family RNA polymerase sigma factor [Catenovulum sp. 2E275]
MNCISKSQAAQIDSFYVNHRSWLSMFVQRRMGCSETTADLVQDTYLRIMASGRLPEHKDARRYLTHVAKGLMVDLLRRKRIETAYLEHLQQQPEILAVSPETQSLMIEALTEIETMLNKLPKHCRQALLLRQIDGLSYKQIAEQMKVSVSSVEKYVASALRHILLNTA